MQKTTDTGKIVSTLPAYGATNNTNNITKDMLLSIWGLEYSFLAVMITSLSLVGVVGNISVLIVYFRRSDRLASNTFIKVLAFIDLLVCSFVSSYTIVYELHLVTSDIICRFCEFLRHLCVFASNITLVAIAMERYIAVCHISTKLNVNSINLGIWVIFGLSSILAAPAVGLFAVVEDYEVQDIKCRFPHELTSGKFCHFTFVIMGKILVTAYQFAQIVIFLITVFIITLLYSIIYFTLWKKSKVRRQMVNRTIMATETESSSSVSYGEHLRSIKTGQPRNLSGSFGASSVNDSIITRSKSESSILNDQITTEIMKENNVLLELQDNTNINSTNESNIKCNTNWKKPKAPRRKIRFRVSAQSGRSEKIKRRKDYHKSTAKMLFLCSVIYIVTWIPFWVDIFGLTNCLIVRYMFLIGNASNPIVYGIVNNQVKRAFKQLFLECLRKR